MKSSRTASTNPRPARINQMLCAMFLWLVASAQPASAQAITGHIRPWYMMIWDLHALLYVVVSLIICYILSVFITMLFMRSGYPPNVARSAVFIGAAIWLVLVFGVIYRIMVPVTFPIWFIIVLALSYFMIYLLTNNRQSA